MSFFYKEYLTKTVSYDFLNKFNPKSSSHIPILTDVVLKFDFKTYDYNLLVRCMLILELLTGNRCDIIKSKKSSIVLKIKKGLPIGCKVSLKNKKSLNFLVSLINNQKLIDNNYKITSNSKGYSVNLVIVNVLSLPKLQDNYHFFKNISNLNIKFVSTARNYEEFIYLLNSYKF